VEGRQRVPHSNPDAEESLTSPFGTFASAGVSVRVRDLNGPRGGVDQACRVKVVLTGMPSVVFENQDASPGAAIDGARQVRRVDRPCRGCKRRSEPRRRRCRLPRRPRWPAGGRHLLDPNFLPAGTSCPRIRGLVACPACPALAVQVTWVHPLWYDLSHVIANTRVHGVSRRRGGGRLRTSGTSRSGSLASPPARPRARPIAAAASVGTCGQRPPLSLLARPARFGWPTRSRPPPLARPRRSSC
jgi:hypothetical protein